MEFSFDRESSSGLASERLRKAIERNRAKQQKRAGMAPPERPWANLDKENHVRRTVATADNVEFTTDITTLPLKAPAPVSYGSAKRKVSVRKRSAKIMVAKKPLDYFIKACWVFAFILMARLVFSSGGVVDFYSSKNLLEKKAYELELVQKENVSIAREIESIKNDQTYQRKIVREHLGFIAKDEFLILFQPERS